MLISLAIAQSESYAGIINDDREKLKQISKVGLFHNYGALTQIEKILQYSEDKWQQMYREANQNGYFALGKVKLGFEIMDALRFLSEYTIGSKDFVKSDEWPATMANIVLVADIFFLRESGLFDEPQGARDIVDQLNVQVMENELNERAVHALTLGTNLQDIFDFYQEIKQLESKCIYNYSGVPYPLTGFKSPTLFICKNNVAQCKYIDGSVYAVILVKPLGELKPGKYHRCWLLSPRLTEFYKKHYREIKGTTTDEDKASE
jgi:hypothetical protein